MASQMLSRWAVLCEIPLRADDIDAEGRPEEAAIARWLDAARDRYVRRCDALSAAVCSDSVGLLSTRRNARVIGTISGEEILVAVSVTEVRPTSFDMAFRLRSCGKDGRVVLDTKMTCVLTAGASRDALPISPEIRAGLIAVEKEACAYC